MMPASPASHTQIDNTKGNQTMAHKIEVTDGLALAKTGAWHGIGTIVPETMLPREALRIAGADWNVDECALTATTPLGSIDVPSYKALVRSDTRAVLSVQSADYYVLQNGRLADLIGSLSQSDAGVRIETMGTLRGGRDVFFLAHLASFSVGANDRTEQYALFSNTHDGSRKFRALPTNVRVVCANTLAAAFGAARSSMLEICHTTGMGAQLAEARDAILGTRKELEAFQARAKALASRTLTGDELRAYFAGVYEAVTDSRLNLNPKAGDKKEERQHNRALALLGDWIQRFESPNQTLEGIGGTAWAAFNAVTEWADHERTVRTGLSPTADDARQFSNLFGSSATAKRKALDKALALVS
jgi:phage/plasmid-like protein (TIGR03299 family)